MAEDRNRSRLEQRVEGRLVVVTGASSGIGRATALKLARAGGEVILVSRGVKELRAVRDEIVDGGGLAHVHVADLSDMAAVERMATEVQEQHGAVDILVNNAGRSIRRPLDQSYDRFHDFERTMQLNYFGAVRLILCVLPEMRRRRSGHIINISTMGVQTGPPGFSAYVASKAALDAFTRSAVAELAADRVAVTTIHMPLVRTPMVRPSRLYSLVPSISAEHAAGIIAKAVANRPKRVDTPLGSAGELAYAVNPGLSDAFMGAINRLFGDSEPAE